MGIMIGCNLLLLYLLLWCYLAAIKPPYTLLFLYPLLLYLLFALRQRKRESERLAVAHRIPFFADAIANALAVGCTLDQAFRQSLYYLQGSFQRSFERIILKHSLGNELGPLLKELDERHPMTGLRYLICLLEEYEDLGIGISPLLKKVSNMLKIKEEAEDKVHTILAAGASYAKLSIGIFIAGFALFAFLLSDQIPMLLSPTLKPYLLMLSAWSVAGVLLILRITSVEFTTNSALRPKIKAFMEAKSWNLETLLEYGGVQENRQRWKRELLYLPLIAGVVGAWIFSLFTATPLLILIGYGIATLVARQLIEFVLKGMVQDQLIRSIELFPDFLQVFTIGLNSGLNQFQAFEFAESALSGNVPELLSEELFRTKYAILCGESNEKSWRKLMKSLPFETVIDFCELMIISPLHGESITNSIDHLVASYQSKRFNLIEKKATKLGQASIPIIVIAFFPLFLFAVFAPIWLKIANLFHS